MKIDEAMTDLSIQLEVKRRLGKEREANAIKLGIEALERFLRHREHPHEFWGGLLPGETDIGGAVSAFPQRLPSKEKWGETKEADNG